MYLGCAEIQITPNLPINLGGYGGRKLPGKGVASNLYARGFVLEDSGLRLGLITLDLLMLSGEQVHSIKAEAGRLAQIAPDNIVICCSHTHSGPSPFAFLGNPPDPVYMDWLLKALAGTLVMAQDNMEEVQVGFASAEVVGIGANRRNPRQEADRELTVLGFQDTRGSLKALLFNYACHPTVLGANNLLISSEYPGAAAATVKKLFPEATVGFINGACGDISTRFTRRGQTHAEVRRMGTILGARAAALAADLSFAAADLTAANVSLPVEHKQVPPPQEVEAEIARWRKRLAEMENAGAPASELRTFQTGLEGAMVQKNLAQVQASLETETRLSLWRIGSMGLVSIPGELFSSLGQRIKGESPFPATIIAGYSNGHLGYIPDSDAYQQGGYEALSSPLAQGFGEHLAEAAAEGLLKLRKG